MNIQKAGIPVFERIKATYLDHFAERIFPKAVEKSSGFQRGREDEEEMRSSHTKGHQADVLDSNKGTVRQDTSSFDIKL